jgi:hypothetical protein
VRSSLVTTETRKHGVIGTIRGSGWVLEKYPPATAGGTETLFSAISKNANEFHAAVTAVEAI